MYFAIISSRIFLLLLLRSGRTCPLPIIPFKYSSSSFQLKCRTTNDTFQLAIENIQPVFH